MGSDRRHTLDLKFQQPDLKSLIDLSNQMTPSYRDIFVNRYGKILDLLTVDVKTDALSALVQYYDPPLRCFTFKDFQLAPTLEEFELIMGYSLEKGNPFRGIGKFPTPKTIAKVLNVDISKMNKNGLGFSRKYLEKRAHDLVGENQWDAFIDLLALTIYGIVLFPNKDNFVDLAAIGVFLAYKQQNENPVPAVLADVYYSLLVRHNKKGGMILCCLPVLYTWFISHINMNSSCFVEAKGRSAWTQSIDDLNENSILWSSQKKTVERVIYSCGEFPNVPLIGTKGCINYNPTLALRQLGYPLVDKPADLLLKDFVLHDMGKEDPEMLLRIIQAWRKIRRKGQELRCRSYDVNDTYSQWVKNRVKEIKLPWVKKIKLPFIGTSEVVEETPVQSVNTNEEVEKLKASHLKAEEEIKNLQEEFKRVRQVYEAAQTENEISLERANKRAKVEEECKIKIQLNLQASNEQLKNLLKDSKIAEKNMQRELEDMKEQFKKVTAKYENQVKYERQQNERENKRAKVEEECKIKIQLTLQASNEQLKNLLKDSKIAEKNMQRELEDMKEQLKKVTAKYENQVKYERQQNERENKRAKVEEECKIKVQLTLQASNEQLKNLLEDSKIAEKNMQRELEDMKEQLKKVTAEYENQVKYERQRNEKVQGILAEYQDALRNAVEDLSEQKKYIDYQERMYNNLKNGSM